MNNEAQLFSKEKLVREYAPLDLSADDLSIISGCLNELNFQKGAILMTQGELGDMMYFIASGSLEVRINQKLIKELNPGEIVGEMALFNNAPRSATVTALTEGRVYSLSRRYFDWMTEKYPGFVGNLRKIDQEREEEDKKSTPV